MPDPVRHLVEQVRFRVASKGERCEHGVLDSPMLLASELDFAKVTSEQFSVDDSVRAFGAGDVKGVGGELHEDFAGKGVVAHA